MNGTRYFHTASVLNDGKVLVAGTVYGGSNCELYDPSTRNWTLTGSLNIPRYVHTASVLRDGKVLVVGGMNGITSVNTSELYDPVTGNWTLTDSMRFSWSDIRHQCYWMEKY